ERYRRNAAFVPAHGEPLIALLAPRPGECVLDLGCGEGTLTQHIAARAAVVGIDASPEQVAAARARGLDARVIDAANLSFAAEFDAAFSNAALHWMKDLDVALAGVHRALKPGGRFVAECGGAGNVESVRRALRRALERRGFDADAADPWHFMDESEARTRLERAGFVVSWLASFARPTLLPGRLVDWLDTFGETFLGRLPEAERGPAKAEIEEYVKDRYCDADRRWTVDYVRLRFVALKQENG
ncbi:MAG: class I SAM-dependent methyltransferase, partial [Stellaceae bacterium]